MCRHFARDGVAVSERTARTLSNIRYPAVTNQALPQYSPRPSFALHYPLYRAFGGLRENDIHLASCKAPGTVV